MNKAKKERYAIMEQINYDLDVAIFNLSEVFQVYLCKALSLLNKRIIDRVSREVIFVSTDMIPDGLYIPLNPEYEDKKGVILLPKSLLDKPKHKIIKTILHEIAHFYLNHSLRVNSSNRIKTEKEANNLALKWFRKKKLEW